MSEDLRAAIERDGFAVATELVPVATIDALCSDLAALVGSLGDSVRPHGVRNLASLAPRVRQLAASAQVRSVVESVLVGPGRLVRSILFDKVPGANWKVAWHQDLTIAVEERREVEGFGPWSTKQGVTSVQPPAAVLEGMITVRVHLDDCGLENGPVRVIPGSHRMGRLDARHIDRLVASGGPVSCTSARGGALIMRPLLLHASSPAVRPGHRRVVHLDFAGAELPGGLRWSRVA